MIDLHMLCNVKIADQAFFNRSKQMTPVCRMSIRMKGMLHLKMDIWVEHLRHKLYIWWMKRILLRYNNVQRKFAT